MTVSNLSFQLHGFEDSLVYLNELQEQRQSDMAVAIQRYYLWIIAGVGIPANILAILGVVSLGRLLPAALLVLILSITDGVTLLLKLLANQIYILNPHMSKLTCRLEFVVISFSTLANWVLVAVALDRFLWLRRQRLLRAMGTTESGTSQSRSEKTLEEKGESKRNQVRVGGEGEHERGGGEKYLFGKTCMEDSHGFVVLTNRGVSCAVALVALLIMTCFGAVFFNMRDVGPTGRKCVVYKKYVNFWKYAWYWINTAMFFFIPFTIILVLTLISVRWLLLDKREASRSKVHSQTKSGNQTGNAGGNEMPVQTPQQESDQRATEEGVDCKEPAANEEDNNTTDDQTTAAVNGVDERKRIEKLECDSAADVGEAKPSSDDDVEAQTVKQNNTDKAELELELNGGSQTGVVGKHPLELGNQGTLTAMMILAATVFLVLSLPGCVFYLTYGLKSDPRLHARWLLFEQVQYILVDMSHALNFFVYFLAVKAFRDSLIRVLTCKGRAAKYEPQ